MIYITAYLKTHNSSFFTVVLRKSVLSCMRYIQLKFINSIIEWSHMLNDIYTRVILSLKGFEMSICGIVGQC